MSIPSSPLQSNLLILGDDYFDSKKQRKASTKKKTKKKTQIKTKTNKTNLIILTKKKQQKLLLDLQSTVWLNAILNTISQHNILHCTTAIVQPNVFQSHDENNISRYLHVQMDYLSYIRTMLNFLNQCRVLHNMRYLKMLPFVRPVLRQKTDNAEQQVAYPTCKQKAAFCFYFSNSFAYKEM